MNSIKRYTTQIQDIGRQDRDLLRCLLGIDQHQEPDVRAQEMIARLVDWGLVAHLEDGLALTPAGVERCRSLQHRVASDREAAKIRATRADPSAKPGSGNH